MNRVQIEHNALRLPFGLLTITHSTFPRSAKNDFFAHSSAEMCKKVIFGAAQKRAVHYDQPTNCNCNTAREPMAVPIRR